MDDDSHEPKPTGSLLSRHRSPVFSKEETKALVNLVEKYKNIVLNKATNNATCYAKDLAWVEITNLYNAQAFAHNRSTDSLKVKWDNLKKDARKLTKNLMDIEYDSFNDITGQIVSMLCESENQNDVVSQDLKGELKETQEPTTNEDGSTKNWDLSDAKQILELSETADLKRRLLNQRSANFTPEECKILLKCVKSERKIVLSKKSTSKDLKIKSKAWYRITQCYNRLSTQKRSTKILKTKFFNMRRLAKMAITEKRNLVENTKKYNMTFDDNSEEKIKLEPQDELENELESYNEDDDTKNNGNERPSNDIEEFHVFNSSDSNSPTPDPLSTVLNSGDSGLGSTTTDMCSCSDSKEILKLKTELLQYKIETAKLKRKQIENMMRSDTEAQQSRATESALRLRAARLEAITAAMKLPPGHPALQFPPEETTARLYINRYHQT